MNNKQLQIIKKELALAQRALDKVSALLETAQLQKSVKKIISGQTNKQIIGKFDGTHLVTPNGKSYPVAENYASKSRLVVGDTLKMTIGQEGEMIFKRIESATRQRIIAVVQKGANGFCAVDKKNNKKYRLLPAAVSYFSVRPGDKAVLLVSPDYDSSFAALENLVN